VNGSVIKASAIFLVLALGGSGCRLAMIAATGALGGTGAVGIVAYHVIAVHEATERQRRVAEEQVRLAYQQMPSERRTEVRTRRYIAVATVREQNSTGAKSLMIYDTKTEQVVGNNVYDVDVEPKDKQVSKFDTYSAEFVGTGQY
jgi:hypothetical protein